MIRCSFYVAFRVRVWSRFQDVIILLFSYPSLESHVSVIFIASTVLRFQWVGREPTSTLWSWDSSPTVRRLALPGSSFISVGSMR